MKTIALWIMTACTLAVLTGCQPNDNSTSNSNSATNMPGTNMPGTNMPGTNMPGTNAPAAH